MSFKIKPGIGLARVVETGKRKTGIDMNVYYSKLLRRFSKSIFIVLDMLKNM